MAQGQVGLNALGDFARFLHGTWEKEVILIELLRVLDEVIGCSRASGYLFENGDFALKAKFGEAIVLDSPEILSASDKYMPLFNSPGGTCRSVLLNDSDLYLIPLISGDDVFGLVLYKISGPSDNPSNLAAIMATMASVALQNANLAERKSIVDDIVSTFASGMELAANYFNFSEKISRILPFDKLTLTIPDPFHKGALLVYDGAGGSLRKNSVSYEGSAPAWVISTGKPIIEEDLVSSRNFCEDERLLKEGIRCAIRAPLTSKGKTIGTLNMGSRFPHIYTAREVDLFTEIARKIGPAVENALIYEEINKQLSHALLRLESNFSATLNALAVMLDSRDAGTKGHSLRVIRYASAIAKRMGVRGKELEDLRLGSLLHDIGKIAIPDAILFKPGALDEQEWNVMKTHPQLGAEMVSKIDFLAPAVPIVLHHHEWFNGKGYPNGLTADNIPLGARIFALADAFDAMTSDRPYRAALSLEKAIEELSHGRAAQFCPDCVDAFMAIPEDRLVGIYKECHNEVTFRSPYLVGQEINLAIAQDLARKEG